MNDITGLRKNWNNTKVKLKTSFDKLAVNDLMFAVGANQK